MFQPDTRLSEPNTMTVADQEATISLNISKIFTSTSRMYYTVTVAQHSGPAVSCSANCDWLQPKIIDCSLSNLTARILNSVDQICQIKRNYHKWLVSQHTCILCSDSVWICLFFLYWVSCISVTVVYYHHIITVYAFTLPISAIAQLLWDMGWVSLGCVFWVSFSFSAKGDHH